MSSEVFPSLPGLSWSVQKQPEFLTVVRASASGQETRVALWSSPRWHFKLAYTLLRADAHLELQTLAGFFLARQGQYDSFLYQDPDDNAVTGQPIGTGDGTTRAFQLLRAFGGYVEPILAPNLFTTVNIYVNGGSPVSTVIYSVNPWGSATPGLVTFAPGYAPGAGQPVTADFSFYYPVRFGADLAEFSQFMRQLWELKEIELMSVKN